MTAACIPRCRPHGGTPSARPSATTSEQQTFAPAGRGQSATRSVQFGSDVTQGRSLREELFVKDTVS